jgi:superfamily II DNA or RNA helicase
MVLDWKDPNFALRPRFVALCPPPCAPGRPDPVAAAFAAIPRNARAPRPGNRRDRVVDLELYYELIAAIQAVPRATVDGLARGLVELLLSEARALRAAGKAGATTESLADAPRPRNLKCARDRCSVQDRGDASIGSPTLCAADRLATVPTRLRAALYPHQREAVRFGLERGSRVLVAHGMGLGKTVTALALVAAHRDRWPALVLCPKAVALAWRDQACAWLGLARREVAVVDRAPRAGGTGAGGTSAFRECELVVATYDVAAHLARAETGGEATQPGILPGQFEVIVCDESHALRSPGSARTRALVPVLRGATAALVCLSGTPAFARPVDLFAQLHALRADLFPRYGDFVHRYCRARPDGRGGLNVGGSSNEEELRQVLRRYVMSRRTREDVAREDVAREDVAREDVAREDVAREDVAREDVAGTHAESADGGGIRSAAPTSDRVRALPARVRQFHRTDLAGTAAASVIAERAERARAIAGQLGPGRRGPRLSRDDARRLERERQSLTGEMWRLVGEAKLPASIALVRSLAARGDPTGARGASRARADAPPAAPRRRKVVVFAHHRAVLDGLEAALDADATAFVRIDGSSSASRRHALISRFATEDAEACQVALCSVTAAGTGVDLCAAATAVFAELHWVPGALAQAEARLARIGQRATCVRLHYVVAPGTVDDAILKTLDARSRSIAEVLGDAAPFRACARTLPRAPSAPPPCGRRDGARPSLRAAAEVGKENAGRVGGGRVDSERTAGRAPLAEEASKSAGEGADGAGGPASGREEVEEGSSSEEAFSDFDALDDAALIEAVAEAEARPGLPSVASL